MTVDRTLNGLYFFKIICYLLFPDCTVCVLPLAVAWEALISSPGVEAARTT